MANDNLLLIYNTPTRVVANGMNAANSAVRLTTDDTHGTPADLVIVPVAGEPHQFDVTNTSQTRAGTWNDLKFFAKNELNAAISSAFVSYTLQPPDPATHIEVKIVP